MTASDVLQSMHYDLTKLLVFWCMKNWEDKYNITVVPSFSDNSVERIKFEDRGYIIIAPPSLPKGSWTHRIQMIRCYTTIHGCSMFLNPEDPEFLKKIERHLEL